MIHRFPVRAGAMLAAAALAAGGIAAPAQAGDSTPGGRVSAIVVDRSTEQPVAGACIVLIAPGTGGLPESCGNVTDERGRVTTAEIPAGTYQMFVVASAGYGHQWAGLTGGTGDQREAARIRVRPGQVSLGPTVRLDPPGVISGVVRDPDGAAVPGADVAITAWHFGVGPSLGAVTADEQGRYLLEQLGPYAWPMNFTTGGLFPRQWSGGVGNRFQAETIGVRAGEETTYDMNLAAGSLLRGAVTVRGGAVADFWRITAVNTTTGDPMGVADSSDAGDPAYEMPLVGPQRVTIEWDVVMGEESRSGEEGARVRVPESGVRTFNVTI